MLRECGVRLGGERPDLKNFYVSLSDDQKRRFNGLSGFDGGIVRAIRSGASRSSSPAMPASVNKA